MLCSTLLHMGPRDVTPQQHDHQDDKPRCIRHEPNGTFTRDKDSQPADLLNHRDYPIRSTCCLCGCLIITYGMFGRAADWYEPESADRNPQREVFPREGWSISG